MEYVTNYIFGHVAYSVFCNWIYLHKQLLFAAGKDPARSFSDI